MRDQTIPLLLMPLFPLAFATLWCTISFLLGLFSGWQRLALEYATDQPPHGTAFSWQSGYVGFVGYRNCLNIHVAPEGMFLSVVWLFRLGHRTVLFPWAAIHDLEERNFPWHRLTRFQVGTPTIARVQLPTRVFDARHDRA